MLTHRTPWAALGCSQPPWHCEAWGDALETPLRSPSAPACPHAGLLSVLLCPSCQPPNKGSRAPWARQGARLWAEVPHKWRQYQSAWGRGVVAARVVTSQTVPPQCHTARREVVPGRHGLPLWLPGGAQPPARGYGGDSDCPGWADTSVLGRHSGHGTLGHCSISSDPKRNHFCFISILSPCCQ